jgi:hypothetical protein
MAEDIYEHFVFKIKEVIKDKNFPTIDACKVFNILVRINSYSSKLS